MLQDTKHMSRKLGMFTEKIKSKKSVRLLHAGSSLFYEVFIPIWGFGVN